MEYEKVLTVLRGTPINQPLISLWRHYPEHDLEMESLVERHTRDLNQFPSDLIKLSPHGKHGMVDFGCKIKAGSTAKGDQGSSKCTSCVVETEHDWPKIKEVDVLANHYGEQVEYVRRMRANFPDHPIMMTVFSPTMVARKVSNNLMPQHLQDGVEGLEEAFEIISKVTIDFAKACLDAGADGIFSAIQEVDRALISDDKLRDRLLRMNKPFMDELNSKSEFTVLHLHGDDVMFKEAVEYYQPTAVNWHDRLSYPSLREAREIFKGGMLGGLDPHRVLEGNIEKDLEDMNELYKEIPHIVAPGCVLLQGTTDENIRIIFDYFKNKK